MTDFAHQQQDSSTTEAPATSVLSDVNARLNQRRRRRGRPPGWTLWVARQTERSRSLLSGLPAWVYGHRDQLLVAACTFVAHAILLWILSLWIFTGNDWRPSQLLAFSQPEPVNEEFLQAIDVEEVIPEEIVDLNANSSLVPLLSPEDLAGDIETETIAEMKATDPSSFIPTANDMEAIFREGEFGGRSEMGRELSLRKYGGTANSERSVSLGLRWLKSIQKKDGSWNFSETGPGTIPGRWTQTHVGATSLALLCFLGSGHTHETEGPYKATIRKGLAYIGKQADVAQGTADLRGDAEGNSGMYVQALATICVSEAYALEPRDRDLKKITELAVRFIEKAQAPSDGGWRYRPRDNNSDTSVVGWQVMALQSAKAARIRTSPSSLRLVRTYLRSAQANDNGAFYGYMPNQNARPSMNAVGLLCRMYTGWRADEEGLQQGVAALAKRGPSLNDIYYNYYATQVMHHWGGELWEKWNGKMREQLVTTQIQNGPGAGSWKVTDPHGQNAGPIYQTALSVMTLEVYYRHLPLFRKLQIGK